MAEGRITLQEQLEVIRSARRRLIADILPEYKYSRYDSGVYNSDYWTRLYICRSIEALHSVEVEVAGAIHRAIMEKLGDEQAEYERNEEALAEQWEANQPSE